jgi:hypothetical protein
MRTPILFLSFAMAINAEMPLRKIIPEGIKHGLRSVNFVDSEHGTGMDSRGARWVTADGGNLWKPVPGGMNPSFPDTAYKAGAGAVFKTIDGGKSWTNVTVRVKRVFFSAVASRNSNKVFAVGTRGALLRTDDGGTTWKRLETGTSAWLRSIAFASPAEGYAVGDSGIILKTLDSGTTWVRQVSGTNAQLYSVSCPYAGVCFMAGDQLLLKSVAPGAVELEFIPGQAYGMQGGYTFWYQLQAQSRVSIALFDTRGKKITQLVDEVQQPGRVTLSLLNKKLSAGRYFLIFRVDEKKARLSVDIP